MNYLTAKFWSRIWALIIDFLIIGIAGYTLGIFFEDYFISIGSYGHFVGLSISIIYFSIGNSTVTWGQTVGKLVLNIHVVNSKGRLLPLHISFLRSTFLLSPFFLINLSIDGLEGDPWLNVFKGIMLILLIGFILVYILNKINRQSLHDLIFDSYVTETVKQDNLAPLEAIKKWVLYVYGLAAIILLGLIINHSFSLNQQENNVLSSYTMIKDIDGVIEAGTSKNTTRTYFRDSKTTTKYYSISLRIDSLPASFEEAEEDQRVKESIKIVLENEADIKDMDYIKLTIICGFNIGIARKNNSMTISKSPAEWKEKFN